MQTHNVLDQDVSSEQLQGELNEMMRHLPVDAQMVILRGSTPAGWSGSEPLLMKIRQKMEELRQKRIQERG